MSKGFGCNPIVPKLAVPNKPDKVNSMLNRRNFILSGISAAIGAVVWRFHTKSAPKSYPLLEGTENGLWTDRTYWIDGFAAEDKQFPQLGDPFPGNPIPNTLKAVPDAVGSYAVFLNEVDVSKRCAEFSFISGGVRLYDLDCKGEFEPCWEWRDDHRHMADWWVEDNLPSLKWHFGDIRVIRNSDGVSRRTDPNRQIMINIRAKAMLGALATQPPIPEKLVWLKRIG